MQYVNEVNTTFNVNYVMNELDLAMLQTTVHDWYSQINYYHAPSGNGRNKRTYRLF